MTLPAKSKLLDDDALVRAQRAHGLDAEAAADHAIRADVAAECANALLLQLVHGAFVVAASGEQPLLAFEDDREVGRQGGACLAFGRARHAEHHAQSPAVARSRAGEAQADAAAVRPRAAVALELGVLPVQIEVERAADSRAQKAVATRQAACRALAGRAGIGWAGVGVALLQRRAALQRMT